MKPGLAAMLMIACALSGCGTALTIETDIPADRVAAAEHVQVFRRFQSPPEIVQTYGWVEGYSCRNKAWQTSKDAAAIQQAQLKALDLGADGLVEVDVVRSGTDLDDNCWSSVKVTGLAVLFAGKDETAAKP